MQYVQISIYPQHSGFLRNCEKYTITEEAIGLQVMQL